jgi:hypothetical protein
MEVKEVHEQEIGGMHDHKRPKHIGSCLNELPDWSSEEAGSSVIGLDHQHEAIAERHDTDEVCQAEPVLIT